MDNSLKININHGNGGVETSKLIESIFMKHFKNDLGNGTNDSSILDINGKLGFTTDSFVVKPIFFPGGNIGKLAVCGTVNDLLTSGSVPKYLSAGFILEEGLEISELDKICSSMEESANEAGVKIVTGDTKVIEGHGGLYINTSGIGVLNSEPINFKNVCEGDLVIVTGTMGDHHGTITSMRMNIKNNIQSDVAPLCDIVLNLKKSNINVKGIRDITRGGLATVLNEISNLCNIQINIVETSIPVNVEVDGLCKILGLDPLYMSNEGKMLLVVSKEEGERALKIIHKSKYGENAKIIGSISHGGGVVITTKIGGRRIIPPLIGESLTRIC